MSILKEILIGFCVGSYATLSFEAMSFVIALRCAIMLFLIFYQISVMQCNGVISFCDPDPGKFVFVSVSW